VDLLEVNQVKRATLKQVEQEVLVEAQEAVAVAPAAGGLE
jgi:hypothetical protein